jgi:hypothetical protein
MPGAFYRSADPLAGFETGPTLFNPDMRHSAVFSMRPLKVTLAVQPAWFHGRRSSTLLAG